MKEQLPGIFLVCANGKETAAIADLKASSLTWKEVSGCYEGKPERSFAIVNTGPDIEPIVRAFARKYSQVCYLQVAENTRKASLHYLTGRVQLVGTFEQVSKEWALKQKGYTKDGDTYYVSA